MSNEEKRVRDILPSEGIWTVDDFAKYLGTNSRVVIEALSSIGVPIMHFGKFYRSKVFRLEDLRAKKNE